MGNADAVRRLYESFSSGDVAAVLGAMDDNIHWEEPASVPFENHVDRKRWLRTSSGR